MYVFNNCMDGPIWLPLEPSLIPNNTSNETYPDLRRSMFIELARSHKINRSLHLLGLTIKERDRCTLLKVGRKLGW